MLQGFYVSSGSDYREEARSLVGILTFALFLRLVWELQCLYRSFINYRALKIKPKKTVIFIEDKACSNE